MSKDSEIEGVEKRALMLEMQNKKVWIVQENAIQSRFEEFYDEYVTFFLWSVALIFSNPRVSKKAEEDK